MNYRAGLIACALALIGWGTAFAGGYWDAGPSPASPAPQYAAAPPCEQACAPPPCGCWRDSRPLVRREAPPPAPAVALPVDFFDAEGGVGPAFPDSGYGGGGYVGIGAFAAAQGFASASVSENIGVNVSILQRGMRRRWMSHGCCGRRW